MSTLSFEEFWDWLSQHPNCLLWVGTPNAVLYDAEDLHWYVGTDRGLPVAQLIRGKRLQGEIIVDASQVSHVSVVGEAREGEHHFELIVETETDRGAAYTFAMSHDMTEDEELTHRAAVH